MLSRINFPEKKDTSWVDNTDLIKQNLLSLTKPIEKENNEWVLLSANVKIREYNKNNDNLHTDLEYEEQISYWSSYKTSKNIENVRDDCYLTIELKEYKKNLFDYVANNIRSEFCLRVNQYRHEVKFLPDTYLVLPPSQIVKSLKLKLSKKDMTWRNNKDEIVIICNNNPNDYYKADVFETVYIRRTEYELLKNEIKFFAFTERYSPETGYQNESSLHWQIECGEITRCYKNVYDNTNNSSNKEVNEECENCSKKLKKLKLKCGEEAEENLKRFLEMFDFKNNSKNQRNVFFGKKGEKNDLSNK